MGVGDAHRSLKNWTASIQAYTTAIERFTTTHPHMLIIAKLKRGLAEYHVKRYQQAMRDLQEVV